MDFHKSFDACIDRILRNNYRGYDPYDGASSSYALIKKYYYPRLFSTYFNKFSPLNFRPLVGIRPSLQNQALGFIGRALLIQYEKYEDHIKWIEDRLVETSLIEKYGYHCWDAHGFPIQMRGRLRDVGMTDIIGNEAIGRFFLELYKIKQNELYREVTVSVRDFFLNELYVNNNGLSFFRYKPVTPDYQWCYNASAIASAYISAVSYQIETTVGNEKAENALLDIISKQKSGGEWWYSINLKSGYEKPQIDFHQGFILDALLEYMEYNEFKELYLSAYKNGLRFYYEKQFLPNGQGIYRHPKKYPVNIHNQAQGIITFTRAAAAGFGNHYLECARTIAEWTIKNMQDPDGHFYYLKYPFFTNKIPYIRWNDAAMAYALSVYLRTVEKKHELTRIS